MKNKNKLYNQYNKPLVSDESSNFTDNLSPEIQALIETRLNSAIDDLREKNRDDLKELNKAHTRKWKWITFISCTITVITFFYAPKEIYSWIKETVAKELTVPEIEKSAKKMIQEKMIEFVDNKMEPLNTQANKLKTSAEKVQDKLLSMETNLKKEQKNLTHQLEIYKLSLAAKAGSRKAYNKLLEEQKTNPSDLLNYSIKNIELFYDADRSELSYKKVVSKETMKDPGYSTDELVYFLKNSNVLSLAAINSLGDLKSKSTIKELCDIALNSNNLRLATRATKYIEEITEEKIRPLDFDSVEIFWNNNKNNIEYLGDYDGYFNFIQQSPGKTISTHNIELFISELDKTISTDPNAYASKCLKANLLLYLNKIEAAKKIIKEVLEKKRDYRWALVYNAATKIKESKLDDAIKIINNSFDKYPLAELENEIRSNSLFKPIVTDKRIKWPSLKIKNNHNLY